MSLKSVIFGYLLFPDILVDKMSGEGLQLPSGSANGLVYSLLK